jgi:2-dehydropantoate 2-reductase
MKIAVIGAGAIGGLLAARLANAGQDVTVVDRGENLATIEMQGLTLIGTDGHRINAKVKTAPRVAEIGAQDVVILAVKAHQLAAVATELPAGQNSVLVTAQNGIPWWYFFKHGGPHEQRRLDSVDPGGILADHVPIDRVVASVVYPAGEVVAPGVVRHVEGERISVAEIDGTKTERVRLLSLALRGAGFKAPVLSDVRTEIWTKLWGNLSFNPISALTQATLAEICRFPPSRTLAIELMDEMRKVAEALGINFPISRERRMAATEAIGDHKTSMLQDIQRGRSPETEALVGSVSEIGKLVGVATPQIDAVYALMQLLARTLAERSGRLSVEPLPTRR